MSEDTPFYVWPVADERTLTLVMLLLVGTFVGAVFLELYRRRRDRALRLRAEWRGVKEFCDERELFSEDWGLLRAILLQYAADRPYAAVTKRTVFDECIARYVQALSATESDAVLEERGVRLREIRVQLGLDFVPLGRRIYTTRSLQPKQLLWAAAASGNPPTWYHFAVADVNEVSFSMVLIGEDTQPEFPPDTRLKLRLWREEDARYLFEAVVLREDKESRVWVLRHAESMTRNQSRVYFRLRMEQAVQVSVLNATLNDNYDGIYEWEAVTQLRGRVTSLSGGGLAIVFQQPLPKQVLLRIPLSIPSLGGVLQVIVQPISTQTLSGGRCFLRGMFVAMDEGTREAITRYIFSKQKLIARVEKADH